MSQIQPILDNPWLLIGSFFCVVYGIKEIDALIKWIRGKFQDYHEETKGEEDLEKEIKSISYVSAEHTKTLANLTDTIKNINVSVVQMNQALDRKFEEFGNKQKQDQVITDRATLYHLIEEFKHQESLSIAEYECFHNIAERYLKNGGNGAFRKLIPEIENKPISND